VLRQTLVALINPMGGEHQMRLGVCTPLYHSSSEVFSGNHFEFGAANYLSPVYAYTGPYVELAPSSFFSLRLELTGIGMWPFPMDGAAYFDMSKSVATANAQHPGQGQRYAKFNDSDVPEREGRSGSGWSAKVISGLAGKVPLGNKMSLIVADALWLDHGEVGRAPYWLDLRNDLVAARVENIVGNEGVALLEIPIKKTVLRFGGYDAVRATPSAGYVGHQVGGFAMVELVDLTRAIASFAIWARVGGYTHHAVREAQPAALLGIAVDWDLGGRKTDE
jgi:hypothetical protein